MSAYLTRTERAIAVQAADGARNDEIASSVGLSRRTVEWHLSRVYRKLGLRSRTELAARFRRRGGRLRGTRQDKAITAREPAMSRAGGGG